MFTNYIYIYIYIYNCAIIINIINYQGRAVELALQPLELHLQRRRLAALVISSIIRCIASSIISVSIIICVINTY